VVVSQGWVNRSSPCLPLLLLIAKTASLPVCRSCSSSSSSNQRHCRMALLLLLLQQQVQLVKHPMRQQQQ
jgi:hypothetical protein